jgi:hypothetical protein
VLLIPASHFRRVGSVLGSQAKIVPGERGKTSLPYGDDAILVPVYSVLGPGMMIKRTLQHRSPRHDLLYQSLRHAILTVLTIGGVITGAWGQSQLSRESPEAGPFLNQPWGVVTNSQRSDGHVRQRALAERLAVGSAQAFPAEKVGEFLVLADPSSLEREAVLGAASAAAARLDELWRPKERGTIFAGPPIILLLPDHDRWALLESSVFNHVISPSVAACVHYVKGDPVILLCEQDLLALQRRTIAAVTRAWLHRYKSPRAMPPWITQGVAHHQARMGVGDMPRWDRPRADAIAWIRKGGDVSKVLERGWSDPEWSDVGSPSSAIAGAVVEFLFRFDGQAMGKMIAEIKGGESWQSAVLASYGIDAPSMIHQFRRFIEVNQ